MNKHFFLIFGVFGCFSLIHSQSITCSENESFRHCSTCEPSCYNKNPVCTKECKPPRCMCLPNFYRHSNGKCVLETDCRTTDSDPDSNSDVNTIVIKCRENEEFTRCPGCEYRCGDTVLPCLPLNCPLNPNRFRGKCQCKRGYLRHDNGSCVLEHQCPNTIDTSGNMCGINEESRPCNTCELTCEDPMGQYCYSKPECVGNTCQCKDGFYRNSVGKCVRRWRCYESGHPRPVTRTNLTCDNVQCDDGYDCVTINPICASLRVPCDTTPKVLCLPRNGTNLPVLPLTCSNVRCDPGYHCEMLSRFCPPNNGIKCVGIPRCAEGDELPVTSQTCDNFKCAIDEICVMLKQCYSLHVSCDVEPKPKCIKQISTTILTCDNFQCGEKETCVMKAPMCPSLRVECDTRPKPQCIPISNLPSCDSFPCGTNEQCVMKTPICPSLRANCIKVPQPQCVPLDLNTT